MAASVLLLVGDEASTKDDAVLKAVVEKTAALVAGVEAGQIGPVIDTQSQQRILKFINGAVNDDGAQVLVDGRAWAEEGPAGGAGKKAGGSWVGPTILLHKSPKVLEGLSKRE
jgi:acyl-CoA reductase-like NAD-dependent aldehyde dehydrogenase